MVAVRFFTYLILNDVSKLGSRLVLPERLVVFTIIDKLGVNGFKSLYDSVIPTSKLIQTVGITPRKPN